MNVVISDGCDSGRPGRRFHHGAGRRVPTFATRAATEQHSGGAEFGATARAELGGSRIPAAAACAGGGARPAAARDARQGDQSGVHEDVRTVAAGLQELSHTYQDTPATGDNIP